MYNIIFYLRLLLIYSSLFFYFESKIFAQNTSRCTEHYLVFKDEKSHKKVNIMLTECKYLNAMHYKGQVPQKLKKYQLFLRANNEYIFGRGFMLSASFSGGTTRCQRDTTKKSYTLFGLHTTLPHAPYNCDNVSPIFVLGKPTSWRQWGEAKDNIYRTNKYYLADNTSYPTYTYKFYSGQNYDYNFRIYDFCPRIGIVKFTFKDRVNTPKERQRTYVLYSIDGLSVEEFCRQGKCITICCDLKEDE